MSERIVILGAGGHGRVVLETARAAGLDVVGVLDARADQLGPEVLGVPVLGGDDRLDLATEKGAKHYLLGVGHLGDASIRRRLAAAAQAAGLQPAIAAHPTAHVSPSAELAPGTVVLPHAVVHIQARVAEHVIVNTAAVVEHDAQLEAHVHAATAAALAGDVCVGPDTLIGARAVVRQGIRIGAGCVIGAGAVVVKDVANRATVTGNPARPWHARSPRALPGVSSSPWPSRVPIAARSRSCPRCRRAGWRSVCAAIGCWIAGRRGG